MTTLKTNKQTKLDHIRATVKRARIGHHLKIAGKTALYGGLYTAGMLTVLYGQQAYQSHVDALRATATPQVIQVIHQAQPDPKAPAAE